MTALFIISIVLCAIAVLAAGILSAFEDETRVLGIFIIAVLAFTITTLSIGISQL